jgi:formylglycine-generating enzyme required for sulfatase activity
MVTIPGGAFLMGSDQGEPAERPVHRVTLSPSTIDRFETTNAEFAAFIAATRYQTDAERSGVGWHWDGAWREVCGADWRHPYSPGSSIENRGQHPVVQVSWNDAARYCAWRGKRLPTEAEWERAARGDGGRTYPWGNEPPRDKRLPCVVWKR